MVWLVVEGGKEEFFFKLDVHIYIYIIHIFACDDIA